ncbi:hypothetical protein [Actinoplanes sp. NBRC 101535]|uniref:hypothetical protein n=1 Tax=Actinoplanes sp. NBRC 101535 TaxID=3032196 RepID=UPI0024A2CF20|nr:hypothetical protein [Actinoplanes sp. NBRC 101535]GLY08305.1 hypothetical protein Acsp01_86840 [Actinoplanes sp. NBRC 101535]
MTSPITGYAVVLTYSDGSGILGAFGPYPTEPAAKDGRTALGQMPLADGDLKVVPLFGAPGLKPSPGYRITNHPATREA